MTISSVGMMRQPFLDSIPDRIPVAQAFPLPSGTSDSQRPILPIEEVSAPDRVVLPFEPTYLQRNAEIRRRYGTPNHEGIGSESRAAFAPVTQLYNPHGTPTAAVTTQQWFDQRVSFEPFYVHQFSMTLYAFVSRMPLTLSERKVQFDIMA